MALRRLIGVYKEIYRSERVFKIEKLKIFLFQKHARSKKNLFKSVFEGFFRTEVVFEDKN